MNLENAYQEKIRSRHKRVYDINYEWLTDRNLNSEDIKILSRLKKYTDKQPVKKVIVKDRVWQAGEYTAVICCGFFEIHRRTTFIEFKFYQEL